MYVIDIGSNAIAFGINQRLTWQNIVLKPVEALTMPIVLLLLSCLLTFGDEILLRLVDRLLNVKYIGMSRQLDSRVGRSASVLGN